MTKDELSAKLMKCRLKGIKEVVIYARFAPGDHSVTRAVLQADDRLLADDWVNIIEDIKSFDRTAIPREGNL